MTTHLPTDDIPWAALGRYFAGQLSAAELEALQGWIDASPEHVSLVEELRVVWTEIPRSGQRWDVDAAIQRVLQPATGPARVIRLPAFYREAPRSTWARATRVALRVAAAAVLVAGGFWAVGRHRSDNASTQIAVSEVRTPRGERAVLRLPDSSEVMLGPATTLRYSVAPDRGPRTVDLDGEAYFTVVHDSSRPFTVRTALGVATDLGTKFGVRAYAGDSLVEVAVTEGKVALAPAGAITSDRGREQVVLAAGDLGGVTARGSLRAERGVDMTGRLAWIDGRLELRAVTLGNAVVELSRWYDLEIRLGDSASVSRRLSVSFKHESVAEALQLIAATLELRVEKRGDKVILWSK